MNELKIVNESEYTGEETSPAITFVNSEDGSRVVFAGSIAEYGKINNQEKSVEITEAGVTEIVPDKGYTGLSKVSVDTSAISGGSGEGGGSTWRYFATTNLNLIDELSTFPSLIKANSSDIGVQILSSAGTGFLGDFSLIAMAYDMNQAIYLALPEIEPLTTVGDGIEFVLKTMGAGMDYLGIEITKEEFYRMPDLSHDGAYIQHIDGTLYTADQWTNGGFSNDEANGIAVINEAENTHLVVAKDSLGEMPWSSMSDTLIEGITTTTNQSEATADRAGVENTAIIAAADPNSAAAACANYTFPNGQKGYLPSVGELDSIYWFESNINELMTPIGGVAFKDSWLWTSLQYSAEDAWYFYFGTHDMHNQPKSTNNTCRPVCTLENYKFPTA